MDIGMEMGMGMDEALELLLTATAIAIAKETERHDTPLELRSSSEHSERSIHPTRLGSASRPGSTS